MAVDAEALRDFRLRESGFHVADAGGEAAAFVGGERDDGLAVEVNVMEQCEHHLRIGAPPHGTTDENGENLQPGCYTDCGENFKFYGFYENNPQSKPPPELRFILHKLPVQYVISDEGRILSTIT